MPFKLTQPSVVRIEVQDRYQRECQLHCVETLSEFAVFKFDFIREIGYFDVLRAICIFLNEININLNNMELHPHQCAIS